MKRYVAALLLLAAALASGLLMGCVPVPAEPPVSLQPTATAPPPTAQATQSATLATPAAEPITATVHTVEVAARQVFPDSHMILTEARPLRVAEERYDVSVDSLLAPFMFDMPGVSGAPRLALARVITDAIDVEPPLAGAPITWVLFSSAPITATEVVWRETWTALDPDGVWSARTIESLIEGGKVIAFAAADNPADGLSALVEARDSYPVPEGSSLWIDQLLMEEPDSADGRRWVLYLFHDDPDSGAGDQARRAYCCKLLRCGSATGFWARLVCGLRCSGIGC